MRHPVSGLMASALLLAALAPGCGPGTPLGRQSVSGTVTLDGKPLPAGSIMFEPQGSQGALGGAAVTDGKFTIATQGGLPPGTYIVRISAAAPKGKAAADGPPGPGGGMRGPDPPELIPAEWNAKSQHTITVAEKGDNTFDFPIKSK
jgi:hypothetical protein